MSDKGLLSEERIAFLTNGAVERGSESAIEWAIRQAVAEAGEEAAKIAENMNNALAQAQFANIPHGDWARMQIGAPQLSAEQRIAAAIRRRVGR